MIDLKVVEFWPEFAGKMNFYLLTVDDLLRHPDDQPSIGIISCKKEGPARADRCFYSLDGGSAETAQGQPTDG